SAPRERAAAAGGLISTTRMTGQTMGATVAAALLGLGLGTGRAPALVAAGLAVVAGLCSLARLNPALRLPAREEVADAQPATQTK
ncbi:MAG: MFS transporter, partial [Sphingomonas sp.]